MEQRTGGRQDLGTATLHGNSVVSRIRGSGASKSSRNLDSHHGGGSSAHDSTDLSSNSTKSSSSSSNGYSKPDRRTNMKRAMSRENVKRPEEYATASSGSGGSGQSRSKQAMCDSELTAARRGGRRPNKQPEPAVVVEEEEEDEAESEESDDSDDSSTSSDESGSSFGEESETETYNSRTGSITSRKSSTKHAEPARARHTITSQSKHRDTGRSTATSSSTPAHHHGSVNPNTTNRSVQTQQGQPRRNLLHLMREEKTVQLLDLQDQKNRRLLHFLLYQHKLGVDMAQLQADIHDDIATNGVEQALSRPPLPLFVEPAN